MLARLQQLLDWIALPLTTPGGTKKPDYIFYPDEQHRATNKGQALSETLLTA